MAKKRKGSGRNAGPKGPKELDPTDARLGPISTFEDVANSEDEHFINQDAIMLDDEPGSKRRRKEEDDIELSDEELLAYQDSDDDDDDDDGPDLEEDMQSQPKKNKASKRKPRDEEDEEAPGQEEGDESGWWGSSRKDYYDADNIETEADALEEEAEAKRLQKKKLSKMREEDFVFDGGEWLAGEAEAEEDEDKVVEVLKDIDVTSDMSAEERAQLLSTRYPEFEHLVNELDELQPVLANLKADAAGQSSTSIHVIKYWVLSCYVATLTSYFAILTSPARDASRLQKTLSPADLRDHDVMETILQCREAWNRVQKLNPPHNSADDSVLSLAADMDGEYALDDVLASLNRKKENKASAKKDKAAAAAKQAKKLDKARAIESSVADLYNLPLPSGAASTKRKSKTISRDQEDDHSDFGEEETLDARAAADKAARKKSLKFYTSQIAQKANKRAGAGRDAGGDMDIPHRERLRDRQARLLAEAAKRGKKDSKHGADLGGDDSDGEDDAAAANAIRGDEDEYYDMVAHKSKSKRDDKAARYAAFAAAGKADRVVENEEVGPDGKRKITYAIEKNKGLAPKRSKDVRNPRVKRRKQYEAKQKKLKSMKPVWQGGEPKGGYRGELSGINTGVVKSVRL